MTAPGGPGQAPNHAMAFGMANHMGQEVQGAAHAHPCHAMAQQQGYMQGHMGMQMAPDGTPMVMPYAMDGSGQQNPQHAQAQQMMYQHCGAAGGQCGNGQCAAGQCPAGQCGACQGGCQAGCQGCCQGGCQAGCAGCPAAGCSGCAGGCPGNCGGYVLQMPGMTAGMMMPGQMNMAGQQQPQAGQGHPGMQFVAMMPGQGGAPGQMQHAMQGGGMPQGGGPMQGQMQQLQGVQGAIPPQMAGHMAEGHPMAQPAPGQCGMPEQGKGGQGPQPEGDGKGGGARVAAGLGRNTQPKQGANWQQGAGRGAGRSTDARPFEPSHQEAPAVPGEQGKGGNQPGQNPQAQDGSQKGNKLRNPKNPWADIQDSVGLDQEMHQLWDMRPGQIPNMDANQKAGNFQGPNKGKGKKDGMHGGKDGGKHSNDDNMGGGKGGGKDMPQQKWVEKTDPQGKGQRGGWQPKDVMKQQAVQQMPMSPGGKSNSKGYQQPQFVQGQGGCGGPGMAQSPGPKKNKKGAGRDPEMDDWLSLRFQGQVPATPTGSMLGGEEVWAEEEDADARRKRKGGGKTGGGGKGPNGKSKGGNGGGKGKAKGRGNWQRANAA
ncbi:unnamed protein product [Symbiodinium pilosum]|uniref:Uncharacterized protein n=1 Tax=Symbiodinium pilosum TaxID=2952 RepID=A0A812NB94_SYMPI|nr:unnamed protein product [Symbiodinium pilosum]